MTTKQLPYGPVNVELFQRVKEKILQAPEQFDMGGWGWPQDDAAPECGTVCCIGGWAMLLAYPDDKTLQLDLARGNFTYNNILDPLKVRVPALGEPSGCASRIFYTNNWPTDFRRRYVYAQSPQERAQAAADYIDYICGKEEKDI